MILAMIEVVTSAIFAVIALYAIHVLHTVQIIRDADDSAYLVRYFIWKPKNKNWGRIYLHHILRSDHDRALHDHPWIFRSFILKGGYREVTTAQNVVENVEIARPNPQKWDFINWPKDRQHVAAKFKAGQYLKRPANWKHRLELLDGKTAWTLVFIGAKARDWGFYPNGKFCWWKKYNTGTGLCEEPE